MHRKQPQRVVGGMAQAVRRGRPPASGPAPAGHSRALPRWQRARKRSERSDKREAETFLFIVGHPSIPASIGSKQPRRRKEGEEKRRGPLPGAVSPPRTVPPRSDPVPIHPSTQTTLSPPRKNSQSARALPRCRQRGNARTQTRSTLLPAAPRWPPAPPAPPLRPSRDHCRLLGQHPLPPQRVAQLARPAVHEPEPRHHRRQVADVLRRQAPERGRAADSDSSGPCALRSYTRARTARDEGMRDAERGSKGGDAERRAEPAGAPPPLRQPPGTAGPPRRESCGCAPADATRALSFH